MTKMTFEIDDENMVLSKIRKSDDILNRPIGDMDIQLLTLNGILQELRKLNDHMEDFKLIVGATAQS